MAFEHLYNPPPCSSWPAEPLRAVGSVYRTARGKGLEGEDSLEPAVAAYVTTGGAAEGARQAVLGMIASLSHEHGDWLWGPAQEWRAQHRAAEPARPPDEDLFELDEYLA